MYFKIPLSVEAKIYSTVDEFKSVLKEKLKFLTPDEFSTLSIYKNLNDFNSKKMFENYPLKGDEIGKHRDPLVVTGKLDSQGTKICELDTLDRPTEAAIQYYLWRMWKKNGLNQFMEDHETDICNIDDNIKSLRQNFTTALKLGQKLPLCDVVYSNMLQSLKTRLQVLLLSAPVGVEVPLTNNMRLDLLCQNVDEECIILVELKKVHGQSVREICTELIAYRAALRSHLLGPPKHSFLMVAICSVGEADKIVATSLNDMIYQENLIVLVPSFRKVRDLTTLQGLQLTLHVPSQQSIVNLLGNFDNEHFQGWEICFHTNPSDGNPQGVCLSEVEYERILLHVCIKMQKLGYNGFALIRITDENIRNLVIMAHSPVSMLDDFRDIKIGKKNTDLRHGYTFSCATLRNIFGMNWDSFKDLGPVYDYASLEWEYFEKQTDSFQNSAYGTFGLVDEIWRMYVKERAEEAKLNNDDSNDYTAAQLNSTVFLQFLRELVPVPTPVNDTTEEIEDASCSDASEGDDDEDRLSNFSLI